MLVNSGQPGWIGCLVIFKLTPVSLKTNYFHQNLPGQERVKPNETVTNKLTSYGTELWKIASLIFFIYTYPKKKFEDGLSLMINPIIVVIITYDQSYELISLL